MNDYLNDAVKQLLSLTPEVLLGAVIIALGYVLRSIKAFPNKAIPAACILAGSVVYPMLTDPGKAPPDIRMPIVREVMLGLLIGFCAWIFHDKLLKKLEERIPFLKGVFTNGDTEKAEKGTAEDQGHEL